MEITQDFILSILKQNQEFLQSLLEKNNELVNSLLEKQKELDELKKEMTESIRLTSIYKENAHGSKLGGRLSAILRLASKVGKGNINLLQLKSALKAVNLNDDELYAYYKSEDYLKEFIVIGIKSEPTIELKPSEPVDATEKVQDANELKPNEPNELATEVTAKNNELKPIEPIATQNKNETETVGNEIVENEDGNAVGKEEKDNADKSKSKSKTPKKSEEYAAIIKKKKAEFAELVKPFVEIYGKEMCNNFFRYWTEPTPKGSRIRYELEKTWDTSRRLETWFNNNSNQWFKSSAKTPVTTPKKVVSNAKILGLPQTSQIPKLPQISKTQEISNNSTNVGENEQEQKAE